MALAAEHIHCPVSTLVPSESWKGCKAILRVLTIYEVSKVDDKLPQIEKKYQTPPGSVEQTPS